MYNQNTQIPRVKQLQPGFRHNGISTYRWNHPLRGWVPLMLEYFPERPEARQVAAYVIAGTSNVLTPSQVRNAIAYGIIVPVTLPVFYAVQTMDRLNRNN